ncbi:hypothetical protein VT06_06795 [Arsukibacterium sp. MJ3]|jgi:hypothetical protein|uniref:DUF4810 domain-containing protein n=1 Tax=Arsukibacterium sp. MJ3 TaxID=1632859 RepID=UPI0006273018|nr:DUF4810 domain-containing protein [Arsukibacterium sp. MJ3]KKO49530.1 hypothetical protein VT06_06795 [Arsukibacterium sp. MJ3]
MKIIKLAVISVLALGLTACQATNSIYYWGDYSDSAYKLKNTPTDESRTKHKASLLSIVNNAQTKNKKIPPGIYAELAMLEAEDRNVDLALQYFSKEKELFPESTKIVDMMINSMNKDV